MSSRIIFSSTGAIFELFIYLLLTILTRITASFASDRLVSKIQVFQIPGLPNDNL